MPGPSAKGPGPRFTAKGGGGGVFSRKRIVEVEEPGRSQPGEKNTVSPGSLVDASETHPFVMQDREGGWVWLPSLNTPARRESVPKTYSRPR